MTEQTLSQEEVDALLRGITDGEIEKEVAGGGDEPEGEITKYDFTNQEKVMRGRMPALDMIHERFARFSQSYLESLLGRIIQVDINSTEMMKYGKFINSLPVPTSLSIFSMNPLQGSAVMVIESRIVFTAIDILFGGDGKKKVKIEGREFTSIEQRIIKKMAVALLKDLEKAWSSLYRISAKLIKTEINPQFAGIVPLSVTVLVSSFEVELDEIKGNILLAVPYSLVEPVVSKLNAGFQGDQLDLNDSRWPSILKESLKEVRLEVGVELGVSGLTLGELLNLRVGSVLPLNKHTTDELEIKVAGSTKFKGYPGLLRGNKAVQVSSMI